MGEALDRLYVERRNEREVEHSLQNLKVLLEGERRHNRPGSTWGIMARDVTAAVRHQLQKRRCLLPCSIVKNRPLAASSPTLAARTSGSHGRSMARCRSPMPASTSVIAVEDPQGSVGGLEFLVRLARSVDGIGVKQWERRLWQVPDQSVLIRRYGVEGADGGQGQCGDASSPCGFPFVTFPYFSPSPNSHRGSSLTRRATNGLSLWLVDAVEDRSGRLGLDKLVDDVDGDVTL